MSLSTESYGFSYLLFQMFFAFTGGILITFCTVGNTYMWGGDVGDAVIKGFMLMISVIMYCMVQVPFAMALSTIF